jgi:Dyp-type peroxidase family
MYAFPEEFRQGALARAEENGDVGDSAPAKWMAGLGQGHVLLFAHAPNADALNHFVERLLIGIGDSMEVLHDLSAARLAPRRYGESGAEPPPWPDPSSCSSAYDREHFGFADGCSQPAIEGVHQDPSGSGVYANAPLSWWRPLQWLEQLLLELGVRQPRRRWRPVRTGEFLLGYENEDARLPPGPPAPLGPNGTFMVYRPIEQHVEVFDRYVAEQARLLDIRPEVLRAKIVGRWPDGTPLTLSPERPDATIATNRRRANDFLYQERANGYRGDPDGYGCPLGAHIRRGYPRDGLPGGGERTMRHRIIRRGMPYGARDAQERGLAFVCFSASISDGFEFIQRSWCNRGEMLGLGKQRDVLLQQGPPEALTGMTIPGRDNRTAVLSPPPQALVTVRGCEYLFLPSRTACTWLTSLT